MKYLSSFIVLVFFLSSCNKVNKTLIKEVVFTASNFYTETGELKSFDINEWEHFHCPFTVNVTLINESNPNGIVVSSENSNTFFRDGTEAWYLPYGTYTAKVEGGGYPKNAESYSSPYYFWTIKDTIIEINENTNVIRFNLDKTPALFVADHKTGYTIELSVFRLINDTLSWTGRDKYDYAYLTPYKYRVILTDPQEERKSIWVNAIQNEYVYFIIKEKVKTTIGITDIPEFTGDSITIQ